MSDAAFLAWLRQQPSCLSTRDPCEACHVRRVSRGSGMGIKPQFSAVPLTMEEHRYQHQKGELAVILKFGGAYLLEEETVDHAKQWFENQANLYLDLYKREFDKWMKKP